MEQGKKEKDKTFAGRKQRKFMELIGRKEDIKYAAPMITKGG